MTDVALSARLAQLEQARSLVEADATYFPQIVVGVLPVFDDPFVELRRWVSDFVLVALSSRKLTTEDKQDLALKCLEKLSMSTTSEDDTTTAKNFIQISTIIYPLVFRHVANNPQSARIWENLTTLKSAVLRFWDFKEEGLRICCIKFAQRVVAAQSVGSKDPRLANREDVSLNMVMADHPLLIERDLNAEAQALLDRIILVLQEPSGDPVLMVAAINCLCVLVKMRLVFTTKIIGAILSCDTSGITTASNTTKASLQIKFVEKAIRVTLTHLLKINAAGPYGNKIQQYLLGRAKKSDEENVRKRQASEQVEGVGKRLRTEIDGGGTPQPSILSIPPLPEGPVSLATIFNLANDNALATFDVNQLPQDLVVQIVLATLGACNQDQLDSSVETIRARNTTVQSRPITSNAVSGSSRMIESIGENSISSTIPVTVVATPVIAPPGPFSMPDIPVLGSSILQERSIDCLQRLLQTQSVLSKTSTLGARDTGLQKINGASWDREAWVSVVTRLGTRVMSTLTEEKNENGQEPIVDKVRSRLLSFIMTNFREYIDFCSSWLAEEWYTEQLDDTVASSSHRPYIIWTQKVLDAMIPYLESRDRLFMRFLSDLPELTATMLAKVRSLCVDPDRAQLGYTTLQYLIMLRPPVRMLCLDLVERLYKEDKSETVQQEKILSKWRPQAVVKSEIANGV